MNTIHIPSRWVIYRRVSTDRQDASIQAQEALCASYVAAYKGADPEAFEDLDTSGGTAFVNRPGGRRLLERLEGLAAEGVAVNVVASKLDRLGRDTLDVVGTIRRIWQLGHLPHLIEGGMYAKSPATEFTLEVRAAAAQLERGMIRDRITTVLRHKRSEGRVVGTVPFGYRSVELEAGRFLEEDPGQMAILRWMIRARAPRKPFTDLALPDGAGWGYDRISTWLNKHNHRSRLPHGGWNPGMVHSVLNNRYSREVAEALASDPAAVSPAV